MRLQDDRIRQRNNVPERRALCFVSHAFFTSSSCFCTKASRRGVFAQLLYRGRVLLR